MQHPEDVAQFMTQDAIAGLRLSISGNGVLATHFFYRCFIEEIFNLLFDRIGITQGNCGQDGWVSVNTSTDTYRYGSFAAIALISDFGGTRFPWRSEI